MGILSDTAIREALHTGDIFIDPIDYSLLGGNSYDVHLSKHLKTYVRKRDLDWNHPIPLDCAVERETIDFEIPDRGYVLKPGTLYLASTVEYTRTWKHVPYVDGKSSVGRMGIRIHATAGRGDVGFAGHWTLEIDVVEAVRVYAGMPIGQLTFHEVVGHVQAMYETKVGGSGYGGRDPKPQASRLWQKLQAAK